MAAEVSAGLIKLAKAIDALEISSWFTGEFDAGDAILTITPGQGGLEAQDWAEMLFKMYVKYAESKKWKVDVNDATPGVELGLDRAVFTVHGRNAYGMLSSEAGVHRLVRISPTDEKKRRQTTFAGVEVLPVLPGRHRGRHPRRGPAHRRLPVQRARRSERQHHRLGGAHHAHPVGYRRDLPEREVAAQEQGRGDEDPALASVRGREGQARRRARRAARSQARDHLRQPDPQLRALPLPARQGRPHRHRDRQRRCGALRRHRRVRGRLPPLACPRRGRRRGCLAGSRARPRTRTSGCGSEPTSTPTRSRRATRTRR